jgi:hypothetical protein
MMGTIIDTTGEGTSSLEMDRESAGIGYGRPPVEWRFGNRPDQVEVSRRGQRASVVAHKLAGQRRLERKVEESNNGAALFALLRVRMQREAELERQRLAADKELAEMDGFILDARDELRRLDELAEQRRELLAQPLSDEQVDHLLSEIGEARLEAAIERKGWFDDQGRA